MRSFKILDYCNKINDLNKYTRTNKVNSLEFKIQEYGLDRFLPLESSEKEYGSSPRKYSVFVTYVDYIILATT